MVQGPVLAKLSRISALVALLLAAATPASAQYLYLDANGDSLNTSTDVLNPTGPTTVDVWLRSDADRDGTPAPCADTTVEKNVFNFQLALEAVGGSVDWSPMSLPPGAAHSCLFALQDTTHYFSGWCYIIAVPPGLHRLGSLTITPLSGQPSILPIPTVPGTLESQTSFGSRCPVPDGTSTHVLGSEWFDADGIRYGGWSSPPFLAQPAAMELEEGSIAVQLLAATDPDGDALAFSKLRGPDYLTVVSPEPGQVPAALRLAPGHRDAGRAQGVVAASDGVGMDFRSFAIRVLDVNGAPEIDSIPDVCLGRPGRISILVGVSDPDGDDAVITAAGLPSGATFRTSPSWVGGGQATITYAAYPWSKEETHHVTITASDGAGSVSRSFDLRVDSRCDGLAASVRVEPNPIRSRGTMSFRMMSGGPYRISIYDVRGRLVKRLEPGTVPAGRDVSVTLDLGEAGTRGAAAGGVYFYEVQTRQGIARGRFVVVR